MNIKKLLIANRGEIAIRIARAAAELNITTVAVYAEDDHQSLHSYKTDENHALNGTGSAAYLDGEQIIRVAKNTTCDAIHPGYGFLSENPDFATACREAGIIFVGPQAENLQLFGDKLQARALAASLEIPVLSGTKTAVSVAQAEQFLTSLAENSAIMIKAIAGGGGRGMRMVHQGNYDDLAAAFQRCQSEAQAAFGNGDLYVEQFIPKARHVEVQIIGDGEVCIHLGERECTIQRQNQKLIEVAPSPGLSTERRQQLTSAATKLAAAVNYDSLGTMEFLLDDDGFYFIEANPRLQVEHTITEEITGIDLVKTQLQLAAGYSLLDLQLQQDNVQARGFAIQARINLETMHNGGIARAAGGTLTGFAPPSGPGVRVDTYGYSGYTSNPRYDSLLAKLIVHSPSSQFGDAINRCYRALCEFNITGVQTNIGFLQNLIQHPDFAADHIYTRFVEEHSDELLDADHYQHKTLYITDQPQPDTSGLAGAQIDSSDPLAVLKHGKTATATIKRAAAVADDATTAIVTAPLQGTVVNITVSIGDTVHCGQELLILEAMKMEHVIAAEHSGVVQAIAVATGDAVFAGHEMIFMQTADATEVPTEEQEFVDLDHIRPDLAEVIDRHQLGLDAQRPQAVARRRKTGHRTARENIIELCDPGSFVEYAPLAIAAQRQRRSVEDLIKNTPADGLITGVAAVNGEYFNDEESRCIVMSYDYTVLAGTQGQQNHRKKDRMFELAEQWCLPIVVFTEGGGGRPGDTDGLWVAGLDCMAFNLFARLSGLVPLVGITTGRCFAGNAVLLGCCDVIIATEDANIGMGGPAMIEGGGLGVFRPEEVGPTDVQVANGAIDILVKDETEAVQMAKKYLSYFQGPIAQWQCPDQRLLRDIIPENRLRIYEVRDVIHTLADTDSVLEIRKEFGHGMVTAFIRIEGRPVAVIANNPTYLAGAITSPGADKAARFMQLCDAFDIPLLFLCDTPGIMVGPESEKTALVRHSCRLFVNGANLSVPFFTIVLRKGYGLGAQAMAGGSFKTPMFTVSWPTGEFGGMGLEGAVKLGYRKELAALEDPQERLDLYETMVDEMYQQGKAVNMASGFEIDDVIDPKESRQWIMRALRSVPEKPARQHKKRACVDTW